ncbi:hypothetical protein Dfri01_59620 [Dyadobacter frigoris]|nr:hypothetical protein Dfri01_59620 [Dyadobacter frigoris]
MKMLHKINYQSVILVILLALIIYKIGLSESISKVSIVEVMIYSIASIIGFILGYKAYIKLKNKVA